MRFYNVTTVLLTVLTVLVGMRKLNHASSKKVTFPKLMKKGWKPTVV